MDEYTKKTKEWLDKKFKSTNEKGVYKSHAPIYGFANDSLSLGLYKNNYTILKEIEKLSSEYKIDTFLDTGCAEGFTAHLVKNIFGFKVSVTDLSSEAIKRAREVYGIYGFEGDIQSLDNIADSSFDLVLCSETIEHVPFYEKAFLELMRITKKVLIITVPAAKDRNEKINYITPEIPHTHLNIFTREELEKFIFHGKVKKICQRWEDKIENLFISNAQVNFDNRRKYLIEMYKLARFLTFPMRKFYGISMAKIFIKIDYLLCSIFPNFSVNTYMVVFKKVPPDLKNYPQKSKNILDYMFLKSKVKPYFLHEHKEKV